MALLLRTPSSSSTSRATNQSNARHSFVFRGLVGAWGGSIDPSARDLSLFGNDGTLNGGLRAIGADGGRAWSFDGGDDYVSVPDNSALNITSAVTLSLWIKGSSTANTVITEKEADKMLMMQPNGDNQWFWMNVSDPSNVSGITSSILDGIWRFVVGTHDGSEKKLYVDGVLKDTKATSGLTSNAEPFTIGAREGAIAPFTGLIDDVRLYDRVLGAAEVFKSYIISRPDRREPFRRKSFIAAALIPGAVQGFVPAPIKHYNQRISYLLVR